MNRYHIRFNKSRGQPGRGSLDHVWRVFENGQEFIVKHVKVNVPLWDEVTGNGAGGDDWNMCCEGVMTLDKATGTAIINSDSTADRAGD
jgi:hypothetical protein